jgi:2-polyprenyl-6-methoxyphenol hydroxylase-like FAD-dependent oxidoreductase
MCPFGIPVIPQLIHLQLWGDLSSIVWSTTPAHADMLCRLTPTEFTETLDAVLHAPSDAFLAAVRGYGHSSAEEPAAAPSTLQAAPSLSGAENMAAPASTSSPPDTSSASVTSTRATEDLYNRHRDVLFLDPIAALLRLGWRATETLARSGASFSSASASAAASTAFQAPPRILETLGLRASFPLKLSQARRFVGPRCALVRDRALNVCSSLRRL